MFCPKCGNELPDDSKFCGICGQRLVSKSKEAKNAKPAAQKNGGAVSVANVSEIFKNRKFIFNTIAIIIFVAVIVSAVSLLLSFGGATGEENELIVRLIDTPYDEFVQLREHGDNEAVFFIENIPEENVLKDGDFWYILSTNDKYAAIIKYVGKDLKIKFPSKVDGIPVVCITNCNVDSDEGIYSWPVCYRQQEIKELVIPDSVVAIGPDTFYFLNNLRKIKFSENLTHIGGSAFSGCSILKEVVFPKSLINIDYCAFNGCGSLEKVELNNGLEYIASLSFSGCVNLKEINLPESLIYIDEDAFENCVNLKTVNIASTTYLKEDTYNKEKTIEWVRYEVEKEEIDETSEPESTEPEERYEEDFEGYTLRIFDVGSVDDNYYSMFDDENFKQVIEKVETLYNCNIVEVSSDDYMAALRKGKETGEAFCDIAIIPSYDIIDCISEYTIIPWSSNNSVDMSSEWWDAGANARYNINDVQIAISGDFNINNYNAVMCFAYNREKLDKSTYSNGMDEYAYSRSLLSDARCGEFGTDGFYADYNRSYSYMYNGGICGSLSDMYRISLAGTETEFYNISEDCNIGLTYKRYGNGIGYLDGIEEDPGIKKFRNTFYSHSFFYDMEEEAINSLKEQIYEESVGTIDMTRYLACDDTLFTDGTSTFKIVRLDEVPTLMGTGMDIGIVRYGNASLVDTPTLAVQPVGTQDEYKNLVLLDALAKYASKEMIPAFEEKIIGPDPEDEDLNSTYSYNDDMLEYILDDMYYELDFGKEGDEIEYLYTKYVLEYVSNDIWSKNDFTKKDFENGIPFHINILGSISFSLGGYVAEYYTEEPQKETVITETWAEDYYAKISESENEVDLKYIYNISEVSKFFEADNLNYAEKSLFVRNLLYTYESFCGYEDDTKENYPYYRREELFEKTAYDKSERMALERLFYFGSLDIYNLSYVQDALDYFYGKGTFNAKQLSDEISCYISEDDQRFYACVETLYYGNVKYSLEKVEYNGSNEAVLSICVIGRKLEGSNTVFYDYCNERELHRDEGSIDYGGSAYDLAEMWGIDIDTLGIVEITLFKDPYGIHIKDFEIIP